MGTLLLVRHGQASFGADNYDQLSALGQRQCHRLGEYLAGRGEGFDAVLMGGLARHAQSWQALQAGYGATLPAASVHPELNEYDSEALIRCIHTEPLAQPTTPELYRHHFKLLRQALTQWMAGAIEPAGMPSYEAFSDGIRRVLDTVRAAHIGQRVLLVSSGGPISTAVGQVLSTPPEVTIDLNMRIRNSALTEFALTPKRPVLLTFNGVPHLDGPAHRDWVTHA